MLVAGRDLLRELERSHRKLRKNKYVFIGDTQRCGLGIFAAVAFEAGQAIVVDDDGDYYRDAITEAEAIALGLDLATHCFQVDHDLFLLPHGSVDDLINHSCAPTAGIRLTDKGYELVALRHVARGEEITYDYSTYIASGEQLECRCGARTCRGVIGRFRDLPADLRRHYLAHGVVGAFAAAELGHGLDRRNRARRGAAA
jgi:hypothetical protein